MIEVFIAVTFWLSVAVSAVYGVLLMLISAAALTTAQGERLEIVPGNILLFMSPPICFWMTATLAQLYGGVCGS